MDVKNRNAEGERHTIKTTALSVIPFSYILRLYYYFIFKNILIADLPNMHPVIEKQGYFPSYIQ